MSRCALSRSALSSLSDRGGLGFADQPQFLAQSLFDDPIKVRNEEHLQAALDTLHTRFGRDSIYVTNAMIRRQIHEHPAVA